MVTFNLVLLISEPLKILISSHKTPGGILFISVAPFMLVRNGPFCAVGGKVRLNHFFAAPPEKTLVEPRSAIMNL